MHPVLASRPREHIVAFYHSDDFAVEQVASFISEGLAANERVVAIPTTAEITRIKETHGRSVVQDKLH